MVCEDTDHGCQKQKQPIIKIVGCLFILILGFVLGMEMDTGL